MYLSFNFDFGKSPIISQKIILLVNFFLFLGWTELLPQGCWIWDWNFGWILLTKKAYLEGFFACSPFSCFPCPLLFWPPLPVLLPPCQPACPWPPCDQSRRTGENRSESGWHWIGTTTKSQTQWTMLKLLACFWPEIDTFLWHSSPKMEK